MITRKKFRIYIAIATAIFLFSVLDGYLNAIKFPEISSLLVKDFFTDLEFTKDFGPLSIFIFIFLNNAIKAFSVILLGFFFAIFPIFFIYINGELIGLVAGVFQEKVGLLIIALGLLPHGIFEIPAMILSASYGIWLGNCFYKRIRYRELFSVNFSFAVKRFFKLILPLIFVAAILESIVTPIFIEYLLNR